MSVGCKQSRRMPWLAVVLLVVAAQCPTSGDKVKIASGGRSIPFMQLDVALALGYFEAAGLEAYIQYIKGGTQCALALIGGSVDFSTNSVDHAIKAQLQGKELRMISVFDRIPGFSIVVDSRLKDKVTTVADLKGKAIRVTSPGSATHKLLTHMIRKAGLDTEDITVVGVGTSTLPPALHAGSVQTGVAVDPFTTQLVNRAKAFVLVDLRTLAETKAQFGGPYVLTGILTRPDMIMQRPETVQRLADVIAKANHWIGSHTSEEIVDVLPSDVVTDRYLWIAALENQREVFSPTGEIKMEGIETVARTYELFEPLAEGKRIDVTGLVAPEFARAAAKKLTGAGPIAPPPAGTPVPPAAPPTAWALYTGLGLLILVIGVWMIFRRRVR